MAGTAVRRRLGTPWRTARVAQVHAETRSARTLRLAVDGWPGHLPGQHVDVRLTAEDGYTAQRSYSLSAPADGDIVELAVQRVVDGEVSPFLVDLPVGEGNTVVRLSQIAHATESHPTAASLVDARTIVTLSGFAPPTLHAMGIRVATTFSARQFNLLITNVPGAQKQMYIACAKLLETYAVPPLLDSQVLAIGVTSYNGKLYFGINADRDAMSDVDVLPSLLRESLDELLEAAQ